MHSSPTPPTTISPSSSSFPYVIPSYDLQAAVGEGNSGSVYTAYHTHVTSSDDLFFASIPSEAHTNAIGIDTRPRYRPRVRTPSSTSPCPAPAPTPAPARRKLQAVKVIPAARVSDGSTRREIAIHHYLSGHDHVASLLHVTKAYPSSSSSCTPALALVMEYAAQGDLFSQVSAAGCLPPVFVRRRVHEVAKALRTMHDEGLVHLDVKLENVVLDRQSAAKLIDFGCARHVSAGHPWHSADASLGGTLHYLSPEVIRAEQQDEVIEPTRAMDAWALGVLMYTALVGHYPFGANNTNDNHPSSSSSSLSFSSSDEDEDEEEMAKMIKQQIVHSDPLPIPDTLAIPTDLRDMVSGLLQKDPAKRMTVAAVADACQAYGASLSLSFVPRSRRRQFLTARIQHQHYARTPSPSGPVGIDFAKTSAQQRGEDADAEAEGCSHCRKQSKDEVLTVMEQIMFAHLSSNTNNHRSISNSNRGGECFMATSPSNNRRVLVN